MKCPCSSENEYKNCCGPFHLGEKPPTAEKLMRSRYCAYAVEEIDYLLQTTHVSTRKNHNKKEIVNWSQQNCWLRLEILNSTETRVEFKAYFQKKGNLKIEVHHERSTFLKENDTWFYVDGIFDF